jgi:hypothetical protein
MSKMANSDDKDIEAKAVGAASSVSKSISEAVNEPSDPMGKTADSDDCAIEKMIIGAASGVSEGASEIAYTRAAWKHVYRWILFIFVLGLNIAMPMSLIERISRLMVIRPMSELMQFGFVFLVDLYFLPVCLFEVNSVIVKGEELIVSNLLWTAKLTKKNIVALQMPRMLASVVLKTTRCFYLINKSDIPNSDELVTIISQRFL